MTPYTWYCFYVIFASVFTYAPTLSHRPSRRTTANTHHRRSTPSGNFGASAFGKPPKHGTVYCHHNSPNCRVVFNAAVLRTHVFRPLSPLFLPVTAKRNSPVELAVELFDCIIGSRGLLIGIFVAEIVYRASDPSQQLHTAMCGSVLSLPSCLIASG